MVHWFIGSSSSGWWYTDPWKIWVRQLGLLFLRWWESHNPAMFQTFPNHQPIIFIHFLCQTCHLANPLVTFQHHPRLPGGTCHDAGTTSRLLWRGVVQADAICHYTLSFYGCFNCSSLYILHVYVYSFMCLVIYLFVCIYVFMYLCHVFFSTYPTNIQVGLLMHRDFVHRRITWLHRRIRSSVSAEFPSDRGPEALIILWPQGVSIVGFHPEGMNKSSQTKIGNSFGTTNWLPALQDF